MSHVIFEFYGGVFKADSGERLLDVLDDLEGHGLPIACRGGNCGTCRVRVLEGESALVPPAAAEQTLLDLCGAQHNERLGCQIRVQTFGHDPSVRRVRIERV
jgi:ferredoxin